MLLTLPTGKAIFFDEMAESPEFLEDIQNGKELPTRSALYPSAPNPVTSSSVIAFDLPVACHVKILLYNVRGQIVRTLVDGARAARASSDCSIIAGFPSKSRPQPPAAWSIRAGG